MKRLLLTLVIPATVLLSGCDSILGGDRIPDEIRFQVTGEAGTPVQVVLSRYFAVGIDELGTTRVSIAQADTLMTTLPVDTVVNIRVERRFYAEARPMAPDSRICSRSASGDRS